MVARPVFQKFFIRGEIAHLQFPLFSTKNEPTNLTLLRMNLMTFARKCDAAYIVPAQAGIQTEDFHINSSGFPLSRE